MLSLQERLKLSTEPIEGSAWQWACMLRGAIPGIVQSFNAEKQTVTVAPAVKEIMLIDGIPTVTAIDPIDDVPIIMQRVPGWSITMPVTEGTECLLIFADMCIDGWWQSGGVQPQLDRRRHDISDAIALFGPWSQPNVLSNYSISSMQIRSDDQSVVIDLASGQITITAPTVEVNSSGGMANPVMTKAFLTWFETVYMPSVNYVGSPPTPPTSGLLTTVFEAE